MVRCHVCNNGNSSNSNNDDSNKSVDDNGNDENNNSNNNLMIIVIMIMIIMMMMMMIELEFEKYSISILSQNYCTARQLQCMQSFQNEPIQDADSFFFFFFFFLRSPAISLGFTTFG